LIVLYQPKPLAGLISGQAQRHDGRPAQLLQLRRRLRQQPDVRTDDVDTGKARRRNSARLIIAQPIASWKAPEWRQRRRPGRQSRLGRGTAGIAASTHTPLRSVCDLEPDSVS